MKNPLDIKAARGLLKPLTLAVPLGAAVWYGAGLSALARPPVTSGLVVWLSADQVNTLDANQVRIAGADTYVKQWNDGSGNAHHATNSIETDQPKYIASGLNGKPVLRFTQVNDDAGSELKLGDLSASFPTGASLFAAATIDSDGRYNLFDNQNSDSRWKADTWTESVPGTFRNNRVGMTFADFPSTGSHVFSMESNASLYRFVIDGTEVGGATTGNYYNGSGKNWTIGDRVGNGQQLNGDIPELILYNRILSAAEAELVGAYLQHKYGLPPTYPALPAPGVPTGLTAVPTASGTLNASWDPGYAAVSYNLKYTNTSTSAVVTVTDIQAESYTVSGLDNGTAYDLVVSSTNSTGTSVDSAVFTATPGLSSGNDVLTFVFPGMLDTVISGTSISMLVAVGTPVTSLSPIYTVSPNATGSPSSGTSQDFTSPVTYTITAENGSTQDYTVTITEGVLPTIFDWAAAASGNWSDSSKWTNDQSIITKPISSGQVDYVLNFNQAGTYTATQDLADGFLVNQLNIASSVTLAGTNSLALTNNGGTLPTVNQNSSSGVTINTPVDLAADVTVAGSGNGGVILDGLISGTGSLTKNSAGTLQVRGHTANNTYSGGTIVNSGTLHLGYYNGSVTFNCVDPTGTGPVTLKAGTTLQFERVYASNALIVDGASSTFSPNGWGVTWSGPITLNATLTANAPNGMTCSGDISGVGGIIKTGGGDLVLSGINTYSGDTTVNAGKLKVNGSSIEDTGKLIIDGGKVEATGTETVSTLFFGAAQQAAGTWGSTASTALPAFQDDTRFAGTGVVVVTSGPSVDYDTWLALYTFAPGADKTSTGDPDGDGLTNQQEYAFGLDPTKGSSVNPITVQLTGATFSYTRRATSGLTYTVWTSSTLDGWAEDTGATQTLPGTPDANGVETVDVVITATPVAGKLFVRVRAQ